MIGRWKITGKKLAKAKRLHKAGLSYGKIAKAVGVSKSGIRSALDPRVRECSRLRCANWYQDHKEKVRLHDAKYYREHRKEARLCHAKYRQDHLSEHNAYNSARLALIMGATIGNLAQIKEIYKRAREAPRVRCYLCGKLIPKGERHVDHIVPLSRDGKHTASNLAIACGFCNMSKHDRLPSEIGLLL